MLELVQDRFPFPDLPPIDLILHITRGEVSRKKKILWKLFLASFLTMFTQPPKLEDEPGVTWSDEMKNFIAQT